MRKRSASFFMILPLLLSSSVIAGEIKGVVKDSKTNKPIANTGVAAVSDSGQGLGTTDENGNYTISNLPAGTYTVQVAGADAKTAKQVTVTETGTATEAFAVALAGEVVEITGTRIKSTNAQAVSPVTSVAAVEVGQQGNTSVENVVSTLPQAFLTQGATISNGASGESNVSLRGLGPQRNLILVNGRRINNDLNFIPTSIVDGIDVLTGGSSAVYGADAIAGVINFKTKQNYEGAKFTIDWNMYQHNQQSQVVQDILRNLPYYRQDRAAIPANVFNLNFPAFSAVIGASTADKKGNVTAYAQYRKDEPIFQRDRDFTSVAVFPFEGDYYPVGSTTSEPAIVGITGQGTFTVRGTGTNATFIPVDFDRDVYNYAPLNYLQRPDERFHLGAFAHYDIEPWAKVYTEAMYMNDQSIFQIAPGGYFRGRPTAVRCDNPLLTDAQRQVACPGFVSGNTTFTANIGRRNVEGGPRRGDLDHNSFRYLLGLKGDLGSNWNYDLVTHYMQTETFAGTEADFHADRLKKAIDVIIDDRATVAGKPNPFFNQPVCRSFYDRSDMRCLPYKIFDETPIAQNVINYLTTPNYEGGTDSSRSVDLNVAGNLAEYGIKSPIAEDGVSLSFGGAYAHNTVQTWNDDVGLLGLGSGSGGRAVNIDRAADVYEAFAETRIPVIQNIPGFQDFTLEAAYRFSHYSFNKDTHTYKLGLNWEFIEGSKIRASYQHAVRAPTLGNLYSPPRPFLGLSSDPCSGLATSTNMAQITRCMNAFGLTEAQVRAIERNPANQYWVVAGGNPDLNPETGNTFSVGLVSEPWFIPGLSMSVDYYNISVDDAIGAISGAQVLNRCIASEDPNSVWCQNVVRDPIGNTLWFEGGYVNLTTRNLAKFGTSGLDFFVGYRFNFADYGLEGLGSISMSTNANLMLTYNQVPEKEQPDFEFDCVGLFGDSYCGSANPAWRHKVRVTWDIPFGLSLSGQWRFMSAVNLEYGSADEDIADPATFAEYAPETRLDGKGYLDIYASYKPAKFVGFSLGINNVFDSDPPLNPVVGSNGNVDPLSYDVLGRYIFMNGTVEF